MVGRACETGGEHRKRIRPLRTHGWRQKRHKVWCQSVRPRLGVLGYKRTGVRVCVCAGCAGTWSCGSLSLSRGRSGQRAGLAGATHLHSLTHCGGAWCVCAGAGGAAARHAAVRAGPQRDDPQLHGAQLQARRGGGDVRGVPAAAVATAAGQLSALELPSLDHLTKQAADATSKDNSGSESAHPGFSTFALFPHPPGCGYGVWLRPPPPPP